jgi:hypothetical protein
MLKADGSLPNALVYDNACALRLHWKKVYGTKYLQQNQLTDKLYNLQLVLDRFHEKRTYSTNVQKNGEVRQ